MSAVMSELEADTAAAGGTIIVHNKEQLVVVTPHPLLGVNHDVRRYHFSCFTIQELTNLRIQYQQTG